LRREKLENKDLMKQIKLLEDQRNKLLALQEDLMVRISAHESRRLNSSDKGTMTSEQPKPPQAAKALKKPDPPKLCGLGMRVTEEAPHRIVELIEGGAAKESHKLMVGDHILKIAGKETKTLSMSQVVFANLESTRVATSTIQVPMAIDRYLQGW
jgi:C-terminal processing protease CtpA/Prc